MAEIQALKKQLRSIRSTQKLTKAMKTVSTVKFAKLNEIYGHYSEYGHQCEKLFERYGEFFIKNLEEKNSDAPVGIIVVASNKGLCGSFNTEIFKFAFEKIKEFNSPLIFPCGKKAISFFKKRNFSIAKEYILNDIANYEECCGIFDDIVKMREEGKVSQIYIIYPRYVNMMYQECVIRKLFSSNKAVKEENAEFIPDRETVTNKMAKNMFKARFFEIFLETAIGAQAATLMTMRSAYDTATDYAEKLEREINRLRQSAVTADVITTAEKKE